MSYLEEAACTTPSQSTRSKDATMPLENPTRSSDPEIDASTTPLSSDSFMRSTKSRPVRPTLVGISEEIVLQRFVKITPTMKVMGRGKGLEVTTFTQCEAFPQMANTTHPSLEFEIGSSVSSMVFLFELTCHYLDTLQTNKTPIMLLTRSASLGSFPAQGRKSKVKAYKPSRSLGLKERRKLKQMIENENDDTCQDASVVPQSFGETNAEFRTAPSTPMRRLSVTDKCDMDGLYDDKHKPQFPPGTTIQDFGAVPDHLRGPCFEVSPRSSFLDGPTTLPNIKKLLSLSMDDTSVESSLMRHLDGVPEVSPELSLELSPEVAENCMGQSDGPAPVPAILPDVLPDAVPSPTEDDKKGKRTHKAVNKFRKGIRKSRYRCLRTPVLVVLLGKELSKPTKMAIENLASGLPSGLDNVTPLPA
ncbi:hypothetical protein SBOR_0368 [Sclerotinia borealis F-4128]|uniref:Uncharacterized protein n=1 Tax=Sclerotinia borealis (strain F-4128) TaxID=1432307 RepID=W9CR09_SCLBF|nr:hypothetical protein SBOR_0368 [Sclerotinia borealis F-4128]